MAFRIELCTAGLLLLLSVLYISQSAPIEKFGEDALRYLETEAKMVMRNHTGPHSVGCIEEAKEHEHLNCSLVCTFSSYFQEAAAYLQKMRYKTLVDKLKAVIQTADDLRQANCSTNSTTCEPAFHDSNGGVERQYKTGV
ncbi:hypothetical protein ROHU_032617 [Labeo rohita]|uniref:Uncharacterized protein n=1 Tax=Labeo rohita TaxID=84645 RepID=A0A498LFS3_LABRO|nr:hypothetical protein ROHU_032617 [Labeo rohita]